jgi:MFS family permease
MMNRIRSAYNEFPSKFWILVGASFIDGVGSTMIFPFFALYITHKFGVGMTQAGVLLGIFSTAGFFGSILGGALTDRIGRKALLLFGLIFSAASSVSMGLVNVFAVFFPLVVVVGLLSDVAWPAQSAMIADMLDEDQRAEGFGILRVARNVSWMVGPTIAGLVAAQSYLLLFILDAISSTITAAIIFRLIPETMPERSPEARGESLSRTFQGYLKGLTDGSFASFLLISIIMNLVYVQLYSTFSVYLRDVHGISTQGYGFLMSMNATLVVLTQFSITRWVKRRPEMIMLALGSAFYLLGFTSFGFVTTYPQFAVGMLLVTVGEMIVMPVGQALVARLAPADMRGRYMATFAMAWTIPSAIGPWAAGVILDNFNPNLVWYLSGVFSAVAIAGFLMLHVRLRERLSSPPLAEGKAAMAG